MTILRSVLALYFSLLVSSLGSNAVAEDYIWLTWEHEAKNADLCETQSLCDPVRSYTTEIFALPDLPEAERLMGQTAKNAVELRQSMPPRDAPQICAHVDAATVLGFDPELWEMSDKMQALVGLKGVFIDVSKMKSPVNYGGPFGEEVQAEIVQRFADSGLKLLTEEEMEITPGKPEMNVYFSHTNPDTGCQFKFFAGLSQTMLLTRNHTVKLKAGSWGMVGGWVEDDESIDEMRSIMIVIDAFLSDWREANGIQLVAASEP
ncbi:MAG: hypothetical protein AAF826_07360 [Pseudomonadota bacterium]